MNYYWKNKLVDSMSTEQLREALKETIDIIDSLTDSKFKTLKKRSEIIKRILGHANIDFSDKPIYFKCKRIHSSKYQINCNRKGRYKGYWFVEFTGKVFEITHGCDIKEFDKLAKEYISQFERKVSPRKARV